MSTARYNERSRLSYAFPSVGGEGSSAILAPNFITLSKQQYTFLAHGVAKPEDRTRKELCKVCLSIWQGELMLVSTDGARLHMLTVDQTKAQAFFDAGGQVATGDSLYILNDMGKNGTIKGYGYGVAYAGQGRFAQWQIVIEQAEKRRKPEPVTFELRINDLAVFSDGHVMNWYYYQQAISGGKLVEIQSSGNMLQPLIFCMMGGCRALVMPRYPDTKALSVLNLMGFDYTNKNDEGGL